MTNFFFPCCAMTSTQNRNNSALDVVGTARDRTNENFRRRLFVSCSEHFLSIFPCIMRLGQGPALLNCRERSRRVIRAIKANANRQSLPANQCRHTALRNSCVTCYDVLFLSIGSWRARKFIIVSSVNDCARFPTFPAAHAQSRQCLDMSLQCLPRSRR